MTTDPTPFPHDGSYQAVLTGWTPIVTWVSSDGKRNAVRTLSESEAVQIRMGNKTPEQAFHAVPRSQEPEVKFLGLGVK